MKNPIARILASSLLAVLLFAGAARAQNEQRVIHVTLPFEFTVGDKAFPSGEYSLVRTAPGRLNLRDSNAHVLTSVLTHSVQSLGESTATKLEFSSALGGHALTRVWVENESIGYELPAGKANAAVAKQRSREPGSSSGTGTK